MSNPNIARASALRNALAERSERERRTLIDMGYSPELAGAVLDTPGARHAIFDQRKYLAKNWAAGAYRRGHEARKVERTSACKAEQFAQPFRSNFDDMFGAAA